MEEQEEDLFPCPFIGQGNACSREECEFFQKCVRSFFRLAKREYPTLESLVESLLNKETIFDKDYEEFLDALTDAFSKTGLRFELAQLDNP